VGRHNDETFSPIAKISYVHILIFVDANLNWPLFQLDVKNAFLHGDLHEEVYMEQPLGFVAQGEYRGCACKLKKTLYGLKRSPQAGFGKFSEAVIEFGLQCCQTDHSVFHLHMSTGYFLLVVYVNDIVITADDSGGIARLKLFYVSYKRFGKTKIFIGD
jgi:hypothetical protein